MSKVLNKAKLLKSLSENIARLLIERMDLRKAIFDKGKREKINLFDHYGGELSVYERLRDEIERGDFDEK